MPHLFEPITLRSLTLRNRIGVSPMCMYSAEDGFITDWHLVHLGARAAGGAALVIMEATAVEPRGRISPRCAGLWSDEQIEPLRRLTAFIESQGAIPGIQIAHAGRKAGTAPPYDGIRPLADSEGGWEPVGPSAIPFDSGYRTPQELTIAEIGLLQQAFSAAASRAHAAGFRYLELHGAHGYLAHSFCSPLSNHRTDAYGGSREKRIRFMVETAQALRGAWPEELPLGVRLSCSDWVEGGWGIEDSIALARSLKAEGVDIINCSSGGTVPGVSYPAGPSWQVPFAAAIRSEVRIPTMAVGMVIEPMQADGIIRTGQADIVLLGREMLRNPHWPYHAARTLRKSAALELPKQYGYAIREKT